ncbi:MAG: hypothetical protein HYZ87_03460 [Candidatus Omnitrophica bacterium]|nr:hypothetical protein [Candidatus Omnitrophota bacterium]
MRKRYALWALILVMMLDLAGCASIPKKFIRKKKEPKRIASVVYLQEGPYQKKFSNDYYYKTHYSLWASWHEEWLADLGHNQKKLERSAQETVSNLSELVQYLKPEKRAALETLLSEVRRLEQSVESRTVIKSQESSLRVELEKMKRLISNDFYYEKVKDDLIPDEVPL